MGIQNQQIRPKKARIIRGRQLKKTRQIAPMENPKSKSNTLPQCQFLLEKFQEVPVLKN